MTDRVRGAGDASPVADGRAAQRSARPRGIACSLVLGWWLAAGCGPAGGTTRSYTNRVCLQEGDDSVIAAALTGFIDHADPEPGFLVYIPATDSTPPPPAVQRMQDRRTTYMYSTIPAQQAVVENRIKSYGDYDALLIAYHGLSKADPLHPVVTFSGHYIGGVKMRGHVVGPFKIAPVCDSTGAWSTPAASVQAATPGNQTGAPAAQPRAG